MVNNLADTKYSQELKVLNSFFEMLSNDPDRAYYGVDHVTAALESGAVQTLLITDGLFRAADVASRKKYIKMVEDVRQQGGKVFIFSTSHVTGEQLQQFTGIAAILTFPLPDLEDS